MLEQNMVSLNNFTECCLCLNFIPDPVGSGQGIGKCGKLEAFKDSGASEQEIAKAVKLLGGEPFYPGSISFLTQKVPPAPKNLRKCQRFSASAT